MTLKITLQNPINMTQIKNLGGILCIILLSQGCRDSTSEIENMAIADKIDYNFHVRPILSDKCFFCHGPDANKREADLRLDTEEGLYALLKDNDTQHAIVKGAPENSEVYRRVTTEDISEIMPPPESNLSLTEREIQIIEKWIQQGAEYKPHWAYVPPEKKELPEIQDTSWPKNEIDYFILAKQEEINLTPNQPADKERLLKRVSFDLTGLPPAIDLQEEFNNDTSSNAYEKMVDKLLTNKHYGEKMAVHWLDVARYADSHGYQDDGLRTMWPWRDWVIHAFNQNYPYDKFITWQLAGDLTSDKGMESLLATGFNRNHKITQEGGIIDEEYRIEYVTDRTNTFGKAFLGLTMECAKCHDHKYDPISQKDYYSLFAFFDKVPEKGLVGTIDASFADPPKMSISDKDIKDVLHFINKRDTATVEVMVMKDSTGIRETHILNRGNYDEKTDVVSFSVPEQILPFDTIQNKNNRLGLANWLLKDEHPLTSRVFVNRIWQEIFGKGIVKTSGDFGMQGNLPTHPELLDWLAVDFRENGWDIKRLVKQIVMSATYKQSAVQSKKKVQKDPENIYFSRMSRVRLGAEAIRDMALSSSSLLNPEIGGPSVKPYQPDGIWEASTSGRGLLKSYIQDHGDDLYRRGMYTFIKRTVPPPKMLMFDASSRDQCEVRRLSTSTPLQSLAMLNDPTILEASRVLAENILQEDIPILDGIEKAFRLVVCRKPKEAEKKLLLDYFNEELEFYKQEPEKGKAFISVGEFSKTTIEDKSKLAALMQIVHTMYNMEETIIKS